MSDWEFKFEGSSWERFYKGLPDKDKLFKIFRSVVSVIGFKDIVDHFTKSKGPDGQWQARSASTNAAYDKIRSGQWYPNGISRRLGRPLPAARAAFNSSNKLLILTGHLRQNFLPANIRSTHDTVTLFNPVKYAGKHDRGEGNMPKRQFMWLSNLAKENIAKGIMTEMIKRKV